VKNGALSSARASSCSFPAP